ncbi:MAG: BNR-4 repeat-containing protein [Fibrobacterota bacterium]
MRRNATWVLFLMLTAVLQGAILDEVSVDRLAKTRISANAWSCCVLASFGQPIETFNGRQYAVFYDNLGNVCVGRRTVFDASWDTLRIAGYITSTTDGHNTPVLGVCPLDGTLHLAWDHHNNYLHYAVSVNGLLNAPDSFAWTGSLFGPVRSSEVMPGLNVVTYPQFLTRPDGALQFITRLNGGSGAADWALWEYNADSSKWNSVGMFLSKEGTFTWPDNGLTHSRCGYPNGYTYHGNRLHLTWCWREDISHPGNTNHDLMYAYSDDFGRTWHNSAGDSIGAAGTHPMKLATTGIKVWEIPVNRGYINQVCQNVDSRGRVHGVTWHVRDSSANDLTYFPPNGWYFHYWRDTTGIWRRDSLFAKQERCKLLFDGNDNAFLVTASATVYGATASSGWTDWTQIVDENIGGGEPTVDFSLWNTSKVLSLMSADLSVLDVAISGRDWPVARVNVKNTADSALGNALALLYRNDTLVRGGLTDSAGNFPVRLEQGTYTVGVSRVGFNPETLANQSVNNLPADTLVIQVLLTALAPTGLRIQPDSLTLNLNDSALLSVRTIFSDNSDAACSESVTWTSRSPAVVPVDSTGRVHSLDQAGEAIIVCAADSSGLRDSIRVKVMAYQEVSLFPTDDAYVRDGTYAAQNFGSETGLMTKTGAIGYTRWSYLKFDLDSLAGSSVISAKLRLYVTASDITTTLPVSVYGVDDVSWTEGTLTWNNRPLPVAPLDTATITPAINLTYEWDVTAWAISCQAGGLMSLCLLDTTHKGNNGVYASKESAQSGPVLVVTAAAPVVSGERVFERAGLALRVRPNPFNPLIAIRLEGSRANGTVSIFTPSGRLVTCLDLEKGGAEWNAVNLPSGLYLIQARVGTQVLRTKAMLLK